MEQTKENRNGALAVLAQQGALLRRNLRKPVSIESRRFALERMITLEFPHFGAFFAEYSSNISMTGMFIRTDRIQPPGTLAAFEFNLADGMSLIRGEAEVVWVRERNEAPDRPAGLGLRFVRLDDESLQTIRWAVEQRLREGGESFEIDEPPASGEEASGASPRVLVDEASSRKLPASTRIDDRGAEALVAEADAVPPGGEDGPVPGIRSYAVAGTARVSSRRWAGFAGLTGLLAFVLLALYQGRSPEAAAGGAREAASAGMAATGSDAAEAAVTRVGSPATERDPREIIDVLAAWAESWSMQRVDAYLSFYAESYRPPGDMSFARWSALRRDRISGPHRIEVRIAGVEVQFLDAGRARASFRQSYESDRYRDSTTKILELVLEDGQWKIQEERSEG